nr:hypothetical protein [Tanacetum cinerariifolium]
AEIDRLLAIPSPPPSPLSPWSSPLPQIPSPPLPVSPPLRVSYLPLPASPTYPLGYRAAMIWLRAETPSTSHPLPSERMFLMLPYRLERGCVESSFAAAARPTRGLRADYGFIATLDDEIRHEPERDVGYGITDMWDEMLVGMPGALVTDDTELGRRMTDFTTTVRHDTDEIYGRLDDAQDDRALICGDRGVAGGRSQKTGIIHRGTKNTEDLTDLDDSTSETTMTS